VESTEEVLALADAIELVREQLLDAIDRGEGSSLAFEAGPIELEFEVTFDRIGTVDAGVRLWVVNVGGKGELSQGRSQRVKVTLNPVDRATREKSLVTDIGTR
jgi:Trypsin-co-occurring domain 2